MRNGKKSKIARNARSRLIAYVLIFLFFLFLSYSFHCQSTKKKLTQKNLNGALAHVVVTIKGLSVEGAHFLAHMSTVVVEQLDEALQHVEVESRRDQFSV